jgi:hypothetical protein
MSDSHSSSFFGELNVVDYDYTSTPAAKRAAFEVRAILEELRDFSTVPTVSRCFPYNYRYAWPTLATERFNSHIVYYNRCKNKNACPVCSRVADAKTRRNFSYDFDRFVSGGFRPYWQTFEVGFEPDLESRGRLKALNDLWRKLHQVKSFTKHLKRDQVLSLRVTEFTHHKGIWTPHFHVVWLFGSALGQGSIDSFVALASKVWRIKQMNQPGCIPSTRVLYSGPLDPASTKPLAHYLFKCMFLKVDEHGIVLSDYLKTPMEYLASFAKTGEMEYLEAWLQYEKTSKGARRYKFSKAWKTRL